MILRWFSLFLLLPLGAWAQSPLVTVALPEGEVIVGQPLVLRIEVLVPTYMPDPPVYPDIEQPNLLVRLPSRATSPVSRRVGGETWSGTSRGYRLYPLAAGRFEIPADVLTVTYADPDSNQPVVAQVPFEPIRFTATVPAGAGDLEPLIVARDFSVSQQIEGGPDVAAGEPVTRRVTATIAGTTAILIPPLLPDPEGDALRAYPEEPKVSESEDRGVLSGSRSEGATYLARAGGSVTLPAIALDWFNLDSGQVETARVDGIDLTVAAPPVAKDHGRTLRRLAVTGLLALLLGVIGWRLRGPAGHVIGSLRDRWRHSEPFAARQVRAAIARQDLTGTYGALEHWQDRHWRDRAGPATGGPEAETLGKALLALGAARYAPGAGRSGDWRRAADAFAALRRARRRHGRQDPGLPPLNP